MFVGSTILVLFVISRVFGGFGAFARVLEQERPLWLSVPGPGYFSFQTFLGLSLPWFFFSISNPQVSQRFFVTASLGKLRSMIGGFLLFGFFYTIVTILIGFFSLVLFPDLPNPDQATPHLLANLPIPPFLCK